MDLKKKKKKKDMIFCLQKNILFFVIGLEKKFIYLLLVSIYFLFTIG